MSVLYYPYQFPCRRYTLLNLHLPNYQLDLQLERGEEPAYLGSLPA